MGARSLAAALLFLSTFAPASVLAPDVPALPSYGIVERVREVRVAEHPLWPAGLFEHAYRPQSADEVLVTLDDGRALTIGHMGVQIFAPGQRVRVVLNGPDMRIESAEGHLLP